MLPMHTILHPTDFSERARNAFLMACAMARDYGARLLVAHVVPAPVMGFGQGVIPVEGVEPPEARMAQLEEYVGEHGSLVVEKHLLEGDPATEILRLAEDVHCDLIILGTHGWTGLRRLLLGSVAESVMRRASCPVLTVRTPFSANDQKDNDERVIEEVVGV